MGFYPDISPFSGWTKGPWLQWGCWLRGIDEGFAKGMALPQHLGPEPPQQPVNMLLERKSETGAGRSKEPQSTDSRGSVTRRAVIFIPIKVSVRLKVMKAEREWSNSDRNQCSRAWCGAMLPDPLQKWRAPRAEPPPLTPSSWGTGMGAGVLQTPWGGMNKCSHLQRRLQ